MRSKDTPGMARTETEKEEDGVVAATLILPLGERMGGLSWDPMALGGVVKPPVNRSES
jgi:hypothetical protein